MAVNTASRTGIVTAGEFAVVKTGDNLNITVAPGAGTQATNSGAVHTVTTKDGYQLTDSSFNHTSYETTILPIVEPDTARNNVSKVTPLASADEAAMLRGAAAGKTYSAFTWTIQFTVAFSASATKDQGLFLDLSAPETYMREKVTYTKEAIAEGIVGTDLFTNEDLAEEHKAVLNTAAEHTTELDPATYGTNAKYEFYRAAPNHSGKAFRIAFVPTVVPQNSYGYAKVWGDNDDSETPTFESNLTGALNATAYGTDTVSLTNGTYAAASAKTVYMKNGDNTAIPADEAVTAAEALNDNTKALSNYLGYFKCNAGNSVSMTFTCVAWFEGTHEEITGETTDFEDIVTSMKFGVADLKANA